MANGCRLFAAQFSSTERITMVVINHLIALSVTSNVLSVTSNVLSVTSNVLSVTSNVSFKERAQLQLGDAKG